ncbi:MAG: OsmC family peroxiredoxin [Terriglobales bacterium]
MQVRTAEAQWWGDLKQGKGTMHFADYQGPFTYASRMETGAGTNPEELLGAAHAGCYSMALAVALSRAHAEPLHIFTRAQVHFGLQDGAYAISAIDLACEAAVRGISEEQFQQVTEEARRNCPVSRALAATPIRLSAILVASPGERKTA